MEEILNVPYFAFGVAKIRVADEDLTMSPKELSEYIRRNQLEENKWENQISNKKINIRFDRLYLHILSSLF